MEEIVLRRIIEIGKSLVPHVFTQKQIGIIRKKLDKIKLTNAENKQWYTSIKSKTNALQELIGEKTIYINSRDIIPSRLENAIEIIKNLKEEAFISGSYLFSEEFKDIDVFVISKRKKEELKQGNIHYIFIPKKALKTPLVQSAARSCVSNFLMPKEYENPKMSIFDYMNLFQETSLLVMKGKEDKNDVRDMIFHYHTLKHTDIPSSQELIRKTENFEKLGKDKKLGEIKNMIGTILRKYKQSYLKKELVPYNKMLEKDISESGQNEHLKYYKETFEEAMA